MAIREVGPGKTYADIAAAATAASSGDTIRCFFNATDTTFVLSSLAILTIEKAPGYTPSWLRAGTLITFEGTDLTISGITIGRSDNGNGNFIGINAYSTAARTITVEDCPLSFGSGTPSIVSATALAVGTTTFAVNVTGCSMAQATNKLGNIAGVAGNDPTKLGRCALTVTGSTLAVNGIRAVSSNGLFASQTLRKSIIRIASNTGLVSDFAAASTSTIEQSILDGAGVGLSLVSCDCSKTTLSVKSSYILRSAGTAVTIINHTPGAYGIVNSLLYGNTTAAINCASTVTDHCQFGSNGANYAGGGTVNASDLTGAVPTFASIATGDYSPTGASSTRNAGINEGFTTDIRGEVIPQGSGYDLGPYEYPEETPKPPLEMIDNAIRHASNLTGTAIIPDTYFEIVPRDASGPLTDIKHLLMVWSLMDKRVETVELPADMRDVEWPDNRGWMAEPTAGNRIWLFDRRPLSNAVDEELRLMLTEDLNWLVTDGIAAGVTVAVTHTSRRRNIEIAVKRLDGSTERYGIDDLWNERVV